MAAIMELEEFAHILHKHLTPPVRIHNQHQLDDGAEICEVEQAIELPGTTILIYGDFGERKSPLADITAATCVSHEPEKEALEVEAFDEITNEEEQNRFANSVKKITERRTPTRFVFFGVSKSVRELLRAHESAYDYMGPDETAPTKAGRGVEASEETPKARAPHYVHLISEKLFWNMLNDPTFARSLR